MERARFLIPVYHNSLLQMTITIVVDNTSPGFVAERNMMKCKARIVIDIVCEGSLINAVRCTM
jgi:hypothetical protein